MKYHQMEPSFKKSILLAAEKEPLCLDKEEVAQLTSTKIIASTWNHPILHTANCIIAVRKSIITDFANKYLS